MRSTKAFLIGAGTAYLFTRFSRRHDALGGNPEALADVELTIDGGVATLQGSVDSSRQADALVAHVASLPGVNDVAAMLRVTGDAKKAA